MWWVRGEVRYIKTLARTASNYCAKNQNPNIVVPIVILVLQTQQK